MDPPRQARQVFVKYLPAQTTRQDIEATFHPHQVVNVDFWRKGGAPTGMACVELASEDGARHAAADVNGRLLRGAPIRVEPMRPRGEPADAPQGSARGRGGRGRGGGRGGGPSLRGAAGRGSVSAARGRAPPGAVRRGDVLATPRVEVAPAGTTIVASRSADEVRTKLQGHAVRAVRPVLDLAGRPTRRSYVQFETREAIDRFISMSSRRKGGEAERREEYDTDSDGELDSAPQLNETMQYRLGPNGVLDFHLLVKDALLDHAVAPCLSDTRINHLPTEIRQRIFGLLPRWRHLLKKVCRTWRADLGVPTPEGQGVVVDVNFWHSFLGEKEMVIRERLGGRDDSGNRADLPRCAQDVPEAVVDIADLAMSDWNDQIVELSRRRIGVAENIPLVFRTVIVPNLSGLHSKHGVALPPTFTSLIQFLQFSNAVTLVSSGLHSWVMAFQTGHRQPCSSVTNITLSHGLLNKQDRFGYDVGLTLQHLFRVFPNIQSLSILCNYRSEWHNWPTDNAPRPNRVQTEQVSTLHVEKLSCLLPFLRTLPQVVSLSVIPINREGCDAVLQHKAQMRMVKQLKLNCFTNGRPNLTDQVKRMADVLAACVPNLEDLHLDFLIDDQQVPFTDRNIRMKFRRQFELARHNYGYLVRSAPGRRVHMFVNMSLGVQRLRKMGFFVKTLQRECLAAGKRYITEYGPYEPKEDHNSDRDYSD